MKKIPIIGIVGTYDNDKKLMNMPRTNEVGENYIKIVNEHGAIPIGIYPPQDIFYTDNGKIGERRRVSASCMVDGYTDVAGGGAQRQKNGQRMRFRVLHKVYDYKKRFGYHMCTGCGRCDDACPEYISFSHCINKLESAVKEVSEYAKK